MKSILRNQLLTNQNRSKGSSGLSLFVLLFSLLALFDVATAQKLPVDYVDPMIGNHDSRWILFPGPTRPFGMVKLSPDNQELGWKAGYEYEIENIAGFSHIHSWTMAGLLAMPTNGPLLTQPGTEKHPERGYRSKIKHTTEKAEVGYYSVMLDDYGIKAELTSTTRAGFHRYTFPESDSSRVIIDLLTPSEYGYEIFYTNTSKVSDREVQGVSYQQSLRKANYNEYELYFVIRFNKPFKSMNGWVKEEIYRDVESVSSGFGHKDVGSFYSFETKEGEQIMMQVGISYVSVEQARLNLETELDAYDWNFDEVRAASKSEWNDLLSTIEVKGGSEKDKTMFYTNLYRVYSGKTIMSDVNGKYKDMYEKTQQLADPDRPIYGGDGFWISIWNINPLWTLATPKVASNWANSFMEIYDKGGWIPKGPAGIEYSGIMVASHQTSLIASAYHKGIRDFDYNKAYKAMYDMQKQQGRPHEGGGYVGNRNLNAYMTYGFVPDDEGPISNTVAYAYDDWTVAQMAKTLENKEKDYKEMTRRAYNYQNAFDPEVGYVRRKNKDGSWVADFSEFGDVAWLGSGYVEGNAWQYTYFVPHDINGLIDLMGKEEFNDRLEKGFETSAPHNFNSEHLGSNSLDGMGVLPVNHGNQPNMQAAYLFNYGGKPWLTQYWVREIMNKYYGNTPMHGWLGDEDQGQMGAWYVLSAMGLFQMDGGASIDPVYEIGSPTFDEISIKLDPEYYPGGSFTIKTKNNSDKNRYIQSATLNGKKLDKPWFYHKDLVKGGTLELKMGSKPSKWGSDLLSAPPSMSTILSSTEKEEIMAYDRQAEELAEWNKAIKAYYYHRKSHFELLPNTENEIIFLGNSITDGSEWTELFGNNPNIKNRGIGGDDTDGILERLSEVTESKPAKIFVMIGTNDLAYGKSKEYVIENYNAILDQIKSESPDTKVYVESILTVDEAVHYTRPNKSILWINEELKKICNDRNLTYIDLEEAFSDGDGKLNPKYSYDGLHLNGEGYEVWRDLIIEYVNE